MRDLVGGGHRPPPKTRPDGGAGVGPVSGDCVATSDRLEVVVNGSGVPFFEDSAMASKGSCSVADPDAHMEEGDLHDGMSHVPGVRGKASRLLSSHGGDVHVGNQDLKVVDSFVAKDHVGCLPNSNPSPSSEFCMGLDDNHGAGRSVPVSFRTRSPSVCENAAPMAQQPFNVFGNVNGPANPWNNKAAVWKKPSVIPLPPVEELGQFSMDGTTAILDEEEVDATLKRFDCALIGCMFGRRIPFSLLNGELNHRWAAFGKFRTVTLSSDCFMCVFDAVEARDAVLSGGPWVVLGQVLGVDRWSSTLSPSSLDGLKTPVWIRMPSLPIYCWGKKNIARIAALIGVPLWIDSATNQVEKGLFARACVRIDLSKPLKAGVWVQGRHDKFFQALEYEGLSVFCYRCCQVGHKASSCTLHVSGRGGKEDCASSIHTKGTSSAALNSLDSMPPPHPLVPGNVTTAQTAGIEELNSNAPLEEDHGAGPWMMVSRRKRYPKGKDPKSRVAQSIGKSAQGGKSINVAEASLAFAIPKNSPQWKMAPGNACWKVRTHDMEQLHALKPHNSKVQLDSGKLAGQQVDAGLPVFNGFSAMPMSSKSRAAIPGDHASFSAQQDNSEQQVFVGFKAMPGKGARPQRKQVGHAAGSRNTTFSGSSMDPSSSPRHSGATSSHVAKARPARDLLSRERSSIQINGSSASPKDEGILHKGVAQEALKGDSNTLDRDQPKMNFQVQDHANVTVQQEVIDVPVVGGFSAMPSGNRNSAAGSLVAGQWGGHGSRPSRPPSHRPSQPLGVPPSGDAQLAVEHEQVDVRLEHEDMQLVEPQTVCTDALIAFVGKSSSSLQGLDVAAPPLGVMVPYNNVDAFHRTTLEGGKRKGLKVEKMLNDLGPTSPTPRKRRMIAVTPDGGDASPSPPE